LQLSVRSFGPGDEVELTLKRSGSPVKLKATLTRSVFKPDRREVQNNMGSKLSERRHGFPNALQHDTVLPPTDCGGPIVDLDGKVLGINVARAGRTETYAVPTSVVKTMLADLMSGRLAPVSETAPIKADAKDEPPPPAKAAASTPSPLPDGPLPDGQPPEPQE
jgi:serine protease Do